MVYVDTADTTTSDTDVYTRFSDNNGATWSSRVRVNGDPLGDGKSQFLPAIALDQTTGNLAITWLDARNSANDTGVQVFGAVSLDGARPSRRTFKSAPEPALLPWTLQRHPHVHCVVPGGLSPDRLRWIRSPPRFFLPVRVLSRVFRGKFVAGLKRAFAQKKLAFYGACLPLADKVALPARAVHSGAARRMFLIAAALMATDMAQ
jgi:hypothetical protein